MIIHELKRRAHRFAWPSLAICLFIYFAYHMIQGERGILSWIRLDREVESAQKDFGVLEEAHSKLENRVKHLRDDHLSLDLLEEEAKKLGYAHPQEVIAKQEKKS